MTVLSRNMAREDMKSEDIIGGVSAEKAKQARESLLNEDYQMVWNSLYEDQARGDFLWDYIHNHLRPLP